MEVVACDVADRDALARVLAGRTVDAVFHAAGMAEDGVLDGLGLDRLAAALRAKVAGAANLHELTRDRPLSAFVVFSSLAGVIGSVTQGAYAAANAYLDALIHQRAAAGLPGLSVAWGPWEGAGMAATVTERVTRHGLRPLPPDTALDELYRALGAADRVVAVADVDWPVFAPALTTARRLPSLAGIPEAAGYADGPAAEASGGLRDRLAGTDAANRRAVLLDFVRTQIAAVLGHRGADQVPPDMALRDLGFTSFTAVELRNRLEVAVGLGLPATLVFDHPTAEAMAAYLSERFGGEPGADALTAALDRLADALATTPVDEAGRAAVTVRLRDLLDRWSGVTADVTDDTTDGLDSATDEEVFALLGREFGISDEEFPS
ncbi:hypothetical protein GCM10029978_047700 [Actinoallomurus acanthiterrae]